MSFPKYPEYKGSGVEWFGEVPCHWRAQRLKQVVNPSRPITYGIVQAGENVPDGIPYIRPADMSDELGVKAEDALLRTSQEIASAYRRSSILAGDIVCSIGPSFGKLMMVPPSLEGANLTQGTARVAISNEHMPRFVFWVLRSVESYQQWESSVGGATFRALNLGPLSETFLCVPSRAEQTQIARFLDHETARIDALIEEQQRLIELLKEKRQAVISHAVTKGLDPTVPMKDSGVAWLGDVPAHWVISQLKFNTLEMQTGPFGSQLHAEDYIDGGIPLVNPAHMINGKIISDPQVSVDEVTWQRLKRHALNPGEIIFARRGELGRCAIVTNEQSGWLCGTGSLKARLSAKLDVEYAYLLITSKGAVAELSLESKGSTMENLNTETLGRVRLPLPPVGEQKAILEYVHEVSGQFKALVDAAESGISLITERRSALISAAVTGKIDVRGWQPPASTQAPKFEVAEAM